MAEHAGRIAELISDDPQAIAAFVKAWNKPGYGVYRCVSTLQPGATRRSLETVDNAAGIYCDLDLRTLRQSRDEVLQTLRRLPLCFEIRDSGGGFHVGPISKNRQA
jgi:hypothetical protein